MSTVGALDAGVPRDSIDYWVAMNFGLVDPTATEQETADQLEFFRKAERTMFDPQVFFPAMAYVLYGNWPSLFKVMVAGGIGSLYKDAVNTGKLPNVLPPFDQPALGGKEIGSPLIEQETAKSFFTPKLGPEGLHASAVGNASEAMVMQGLWELLGIAVGGPLGGMAKKKPGVLGQRRIIEGAEEAIKFAEKELNMKFPAAFLNSEGFGRMVWDFSHSTITSEPVWNKWMSEAVESFSEKATAKMFETFTDTVVDGVSTIMPTRDIGRLVGDVLSGNKQFSGLMENFYWRKIQELDRYKVRVDMSKVKGTIRHHADGVVEAMNPEERKFFRELIDEIDNRVSEVRTLSDHVGKPVKNDIIIDETPLQMRFTVADQNRKFIRRMVGKVDDGKAKQLLIEIAEEMDTAMMEAAKRISPEAHEIFMKAKEFTQKQHDIMDKKVIKELLAKHGGKQELWAGIADDIKMAAKTGEGPDLVAQLNTVIDDFIENRKSYLSGQYDIPEPMVDAVYEEWRVNYFDDLREPAIDTGGKPPRDRAPYEKTIPVKAELGFKGGDVEQVMERIRKDMTFEEFEKLLTVSKEGILEDLRISIVNDIMGSVEGITEMSTHSGFKNRMMNKMRDTYRELKTAELTEAEYRTKIRELAGFDPIRLHEELLEGPASQQETYRKLFKPSQLRSIAEVTHHLAVITGGGLKYKSNVMVIKLVQAGVLATVAVKSVPLGDEDQSYEWKDAMSAGLVLLAPWALTKIMLKQAWAKWFVKGFTGGTVTRGALSNIGRLSMALWQEEGVPLFIGGGIDAAKNSKLGRSVAGVLGANEPIEGGPDAAR
jgi:hypothetical protein